MGLDRIGKYRILAKIGEGAMGEVYRAHDPQLNRHVAIKTIASSFGRDADFRKRFQREAQAAAQLNHPHIITVFDFGEEDGITYMAMELLEGKDLKDVIAAGKLASLRDKLTVMQQVCDGVAFAHAKGVVHRDLKPGNIHIQPNGQAKVLDFGLARTPTSDMTRTGTVMGTPHYMSPEQVRGEKANARSDVFSLGAVFYEVLTRHRPFGNDAQHQVLMRILSEDPPPVRQWAPDTPDLVAAVAERALSREPAERYADAGAMGATLRRVHQSLPPTLLYDDERAGADEAETAVWNQAEATIMIPGVSRPAVAGTAALDVERSQAAETALIGTAHTARTVVTPATEPPRAGRAWLWAVGVVLVAATAVGTWAWLRRPGGAPAGTASEHVGILTEALVTNQVELAKTDLANRDYEAAVRQAEQALELSPENADARHVFELARRTLGERDAAVEEARSAFAAGDAEKATRALGRVMSLDPRHPVVAELSGALNERFRQQAERARDEARQARAAADRDNSRREEGYREGDRLEREAAALFRQQEFTSAAQRYVQSRNAFDQARRDAEAGRAAVAARAEAAARAAELARATPSPSAPPTPVPTPRAAAASTPVPPRASPTATPSRPDPSRATPSQTLPSATTRPAAPPTAAPPVALTPPPRAEVLRVVADYERALETQDIGLYRSIYLNLTDDEEKKVRTSFDQIKDYQLDLVVGDVDVEGDRATVRTTRLDTIKGKQMKQRDWVFRLVRQEGRWRIESMAGN